ncbi:MAG: disulfide bond formation protein B [Aquihabitans sp.]
MDKDVVILFFALLATFAQLVVVAALVLWLGSKVSPAIDRAKGSVLAAVGPQALAMAAVVATACTLGSLYLSEASPEFLPCRLCWFQRTAMYPLVVVLGVAAIRKDLGARLTGGILAGIGACISIWHLLVEQYPNLESSSCDPNNPCSFKWVDQWGYLTIPGMALSGFALILVLLAAARPDPSEEQP